MCQEETSPRGRDRPAASGQTRAFRWSPAVPNGTTGTMVALSPYQSGANGINASGAVVGADAVW